MMDKMIIILREKIIISKKKTPLHQKVTVPYVKLITQYVKSLSSWNSKYELILIAIIYNLGSITKMGYKDVNNDGKYAKVKRVQGDDEDA